MLMITSRAGGIIAPAQVATSTCCLELLRTISGQLLGSCQLLRSRCRSCCDHLCRCDRPLVDLQLLLNNTAQQASALH